jgi:hypothetical protein
MAFLVLVNYHRRKLGELAGQSIGLISIKLALLLDSNKKIKTLL